MFSDHEIVKVFHGAGSDIVWLQKSFNIHYSRLSFKSELSAYKSVLCQYWPGGHDQVGTIGQVAWSGSGHGQDMVSNGCQFFLVKKFGSGM